MSEKIILPNLGKENKVIFGCIVGSHAYGTNVEGSDIDRKWVYVQSADDLFINGYKPQIEISKDETAYELSRFLELAQKANPTILELFFAPNDCIIYQHEAFDKVRAIRNYFLTKKCRLSFGGYAISQIEKAKGLDKKMNWEKERTERKDVMDFCYWIQSAIDPKRGDNFQSQLIKDHFVDGQIKNMGLSKIPHTKDLYNLFWDARYPFKGITQGSDSNDISLSDVPKDANCIGMLYFNKEEYTKHCRDYKEYQEWLNKRNTQRYVDTQNHQQQIDGKNLLHCVRLIETALEIATTNTLLVRRPNADILKKIRKGEYNLDEVILFSQKTIEKMDEAFKNSSLPDDFKAIDWLKQLNRNIRQQLAQETKKEQKPSY
jgi:hypothetical protein